MSKKRVSTVLTHYDGKKKDNNGIWRIVGQYKTPKKAFEDGCIKATPRYTRING